MSGEEIVALIKEGLLKMPKEVYTIVILPNAKYIIPFCIFIGLYISRNFISGCLRKWINKIS